MFTPVTSLPPAPRRVPTGCPHLDALFGGGLPPRGITEVCGEAGSGKTQLCLTLALHCVLPPRLGGLGGTCAFLCTEDALPTTRLEAVARALLARLAATEQPQPVQPPPEQTPPLPTVAALLERVRVARVADRAQLEERLGQLSRLLSSERSTRLIVVDSVAALHRDLLAQPGFDAPDRARGLLSLAALLKGFNHEHGAAVVVVNQVSDVVDEPRLLDTARLCGPATVRTSAVREAAAAGLARQMCAVHSNGRWVRPALGIVWDSCVTTRVMMTHPRLGDSFALSGGGGGATTHKSGGGNGGGGKRSRQGLGSPVRSAAAVAAASAIELELGDIDFGVWDRELAERHAEQRRQVQPQNQLQVQPPQASPPRQMFLLLGGPPTTLDFDVTALGVEGQGPPLAGACW